MSRVLVGYLLLVMGKTNRNTISKMGKVKLRARHQLIAEALGISLAAPALMNQLGAVILAKTNE
jgi:hypothetical protein